MQNKILMIFFHDSLVYYTMPSLAYPRDFQNRKSAGNLKTHGTIEIVIIFIVISNICVVDWTKNLGIVLYAYKFYMMKNNTRSFFPRGGISGMNLVQVGRWASSYPPYKCILEYGKSIPINVYTIMEDNKKCSLFPFKLSCLMQKIISTVKC